MRLTKMNTEYITFKKLIPRLALLENNSILKIVDMSDYFSARTRIVFKNGYQLSVVIGPISYGSDRGLFELSPFNANGEMDGSLLDDGDSGDDVLGFCSAEKVNHYINKIGSLTS